MVPQADSLPLLVLALLTLFDARRTDSEEYFKVNFKALRTGQQFS